jgi:hypothetical protein
MNENSVRQIVTKAEVDAIRNLFESKFKNVKFPEPIIDATQMNFILLNGEPLLIEYCFNTIKDFMIQNKESHAYAIVASVLKEGNEIYFDQHLYKKQSNHTTSVVLEFSSDCSFLSLKAAFSSSSDYYVEDYFIFSDTLNWVVQAVAFKATYILFFQDLIQIRNTKILGDALYTYSELLEFNLDGFNKAEEKSLKEYWLPNQYKFDMK